MSPIRRANLLAGQVAVVTMIVVTTVDGLLRPGYSVTRHWISHLSLGDRGWLGVTNLLVCGLLFAVFGLGLRRVSRAGAVLVTLAGSALVVAGLVPTDPGLDFPPGTANVRTPMGSVHEAAAGVLFLSLIIAAVVLGRASGRRGAGIAVAVGIVISFALCSVLVALDYSGTWPSAPSGLFEKVALFLAMAWPVAVAVRSRASSPVPTPTATAQRR
ncbi:MAG: DUF998 domain-containing protein [Micromonosporaceae bacterium]|nr:DUF998 domain-containing protein [Micromonosporaceae bacterium]